MNQKKLILPVMASLLFSASFAHAQTKADAAPGQTVEAQKGEAADAKKLTEKSAQRSDENPVVKERPRLENMDRNQDGFVDLREAEEFAGDQFDNMDDNKDGLVTTEEMDLFHHARRGMWAAKREEGGDKAAPALSAETQARMKAKAAERGHNQLGRLDKDGDGKVDRAEFTSHALARHKKMDLDGDSKVTKEEVRATQEKMSKERKERRERARAGAPAADADKAE